ncbi:MAG: hypothetical protein J1F31_01880 [Erysipelotrichales bacterium]|nr:hypothetical protein [Erysipelotrichales bacterium]
MKTLLNNYCFSEKKGGLLLIDMPTGIGKTHDAIEFIYENYKKAKNKIIFITNLKKNLPIADLQEYFKKDNRLDEFENDVLFLDNNVDTLIDHFDEVKTLIPRDKFNKNGILNNVETCINIIHTLKPALNKRKDMARDIVSKDNTIFIINQAKENLRDKYEKEFRLVIEEVLKIDADGKKRTKAQKLQLIKDDSDYQWISKLYPAVFTDEKKILFMSIDKFLVRNSTIIEPSYNFLDNKSLLNDSIIFIDEFDSSKEIFLNNIIDDCLNTEIGIIELFRIIYSGLETTNFSRLLTEVSKKLFDNINNKKLRYYTPEKILNEFSARAKEIEEKYNLVDFHKLEVSEKEKANFLFQDYQFHTVLNDEKKFVYFENDHKQHINWIKSSNSKKTTEEESLFSLLNEIKSFLVYFQNGVKLIADNYLSLKNDRNQETNNFSYEAAVKTVLSEFGIDGKYLNYLTSQILNTKKTKSVKLVDLKSELDCSVYEKGFRFYNLIDNDSFDTQSKINLISFNISPEKLLIYLCSNSKVVGISASGTLNTVTGNYDLPYVKSKLGHLYYELSRDEQDRINNFVMKNLGDYSNVKIDIDKCIINDKNYYDVIQNFLTEDEFKLIKKKIDKITTEDYMKSRYCKVTYAIHNFFVRNINSFLFLTNVSMNNSMNFNYEVVKFIFKTLKTKYCKNAYLYSLDGPLDKFENLKENIFSKLKEGNDVFVVSSYQSIGAGQNLQYEYNEMYEDLLETIKDSSYGKKYKDFDALFLDKPTNLFVNMNSSPTEEQLLKFIYQIKCLEEVGFFTLEQANIEIKKGIKRLYHTSTQRIRTPRSKHLYMHTAKIILQAIGRICRTNKKNKNIYISFDQQMETELAICKEDLLNIQINYELRKLLSECKNIKIIDDQSIHNVNNSKIRKINDRLETLKQFKFESDIEKWEELRDVVLKHPYDNDEIHFKYDIYVELKEASNHYYYNLNEYNEINVTYSMPNDFCICENSSNLKTLMSINGVKDYFELKGYATSFQKSRYILFPNVFNRIYLGALGEVVGEFLVNKILEPFNFKLERIRELERYEKFDFVFDNDKYIDFKYWSGMNDKERTAEVNRALKKLDKCQGKICYIINILKPENYDPKLYISADSRLIIIPYLYNPETCKFNNNAIELLLKNSF